MVIFSQQVKYFRKERKIKNLANSKNSHFGRLRRPMLPLGFIQSSILYFGQTVLYANLHIAFFNISHRGTLNILYRPVLNILHRASLNMLHRGNILLHRAACEKTFHAIFSLFLLVLNCKQFYQHRHDPRIPKLCSDLKLNHGKWVKKLDRQTYRQMNLREF